MKKLLPLTLLSLFCLYTLIPFAQDATFSYAKKMGGTNEDVGMSISVDADGNIYTVGHFSGTANFDPSTQLTSFGANDTFVTKHDASGNLLWVKQIGGTRNVTPNCIKVNGEGNIYIAGVFVGTADFDPSINIFNFTSNYGNGDNFILKLNAQGDFIWAKQISGSGYVVTNSISIDSDENILTTGLFGSTIDFNPNLGINNVTSVGGYDIFILKLDSYGNFIWVKQIGGVGYDYGQSIDIDINGSIYTTGYFSGIGDFDPNGGVNYLTSFGDDDIFISKLDASGNFVWAKQMGGYNTDRGFSIAVDNLGNVYSTGFFKGSADFDPSTTIYNLTSSMNYTVFVSKLNSSGNFVWAKKMGGVSPSIGFSIALDVIGNVYTFGLFGGTANFNPNTGVYNMTAKGDYDLFISKLT